MFLRLNYGQTSFWSLTGSIFGLFGVNYCTRSKLFGKGTRLSDCCDGVLSFGKLALGEMEGYLRLSLLFDMGMSLKSGS